VGWFFHPIFFSGAPNDRPTCVCRWMVVVVSVWVGGWVKGGGFDDGGGDGGGGERGSSVVVIVVVVCGGRGRGRGGVWMGEKEEEEEETPGWDLAAVCLSMHVWMPDATTPLVYATPLSAQTHTPQKLRTGRALLHHDAGDAPRAGPPRAAHDEVEVAEPAPADEGLLYIWYGMCVRENDSVVITCM
jgi:hypothetical protein